MGRGPSKNPIEHGKNLFDALRVYEIAFLDDGGMIEGSLEQHLKYHKCAYMHDMAAYLLSQSIVKADVKSGRNKKYYYWNGKKLSIQYCNDLYLQMKLSNKATVDFERADKVENVWQTAISEVEVDIHRAEQEIKKLNNVLEYLKTKL